MDCVLCSAKENDRMICSDEFSYCIVNRYPILPGHVMVLPLRHVENLRDLTPEESESVFSLSERMSDILRGLYKREVFMFISTGGLKTSPIFTFMYCLLIFADQETLCTNFVEKKRNMRRFPWAK